MFAAKIAGEAMPRWRVWLDGMASLSVVIVCLTVAWAVVFRGGITISPSGTQKPVNIQRPADNAAIPPVPVSVSDAAIKGNPTAPVAVIEYADFQCPYCSVFAKETLPKLNEYVNAGQVFIAFRHMPLAGVHPDAVAAAEAAECARREGKFWDLHDTLFRGPSQLNPAALTAYGKSLGLGPSFERCLTGEATAKIREEVRIAGGLGIGGTPSFFIGRREPDGRVKVTARFSGAAPIERFRAEIDKLVPKTVALR